VLVTPFSFAANKLWAFAGRTAVDAALDPRSKAGHHEAPAF